MSSPKPIASFGIPLTEVPDVPEPIIGWRAWDTEPRTNHRTTWPFQIAPESRLRSGFDGTVWRRSSPTIARCPAGCASVPASPDELAVRPHVGHGCGLYAWRTADFALHQLAPRASVWGRVAVHGHVWEHGQGYRSDAATVTGIGLPIYLFAPHSGQREVAIALAVIYDVPLIAATPRWWHVFGPTADRFGPDLDDLLADFAEPAGPQPLMGFQLSEVPVDAWCRIERLCPALGLPAGHHFPTTPDRLAELVTIAQGGHRGRDR